MVIIPAPTKRLQKKKSTNWKPSWKQRQEREKADLSCFLSTRQSSILEGYLETGWGIKIGSGVIWETNASNVLWLFLLQHLKHPDRQRIYRWLGRQHFSLHERFRPVTAAFETKSEMKTTSLITSADTCVLQPMDAGEDWTPDNETKRAFSAAVPVLTYKIRFRHQ